MAAVLVHGPTASAINFRKLFVDAAFSWFCFSEKSHLNSLWERSFSILFPEKFFDENLFEGKPRIPVGHVLFKR